MHTASPSPVTETKIIMSDPTALVVFGLALSIFGVNMHFFTMVAAYSELTISLLGFLLWGAVFLNSYFGRTLLPTTMPKPASPYSVGQKKRCLHSFCIRHCFNQRLTT